MLNHFLGQQKCLKKNRVPQLSLFVIVMITAARIFHPKYGFVYTQFLKALLGMVSIVG